MASFFISHSSRDGAASKQVRERLRGEGYESVFLDFHPEEGIPAGRDWERELYAQLRSCDAVVYLCSAASLESRWCFAELALARATGKPIFPIALEPEAGHPLLADTQSIEWIGVGDDGEAAFERLWRGFREHGFDPRDAFAWDPTRPPFPGLSPLEAEDAAVFFGRSTEIEELVSRLQPILASSRRLVCVIGPSGSGKSSLVRAGLVPRLQRMGERWAVVPPLRPGNRPLTALAAALGAGDWRQIRDRIGRDPAELAGVMDDLLAGTGGSATSVLLVIDQAEELVTADAEERAAFIDAVGAALDESSSLWVVATLRSEYVTAVLRERAIADAIGPAVVLGHLDRSRIPEVIEAPARKGGVELDPGLMGRMVEDTIGGDALPLLAYTLRQLYERAGPNRRITTEDYETIGGVLGALRGRADAISAELGERGKGDLVVPTLLRFASVEQDGEPIGRRLITRSLGRDEKEIVRAFVEARLLTSAGEGDDAVVGVAHDSLLRSWAPLRQAIDASRETLRLRSELERLAHEWDSAGRLDSYLLREERLAGASSYLESEPGSGELSPLHEFVERSRAQSQAALRREADLLAGRVLEILDDEPELGFLLALAAVEEYCPTPRGIHVLNAALAASRVRRYLRGHESGVRGAAFSPDGGRVVTASADGTARLWNAADGAELRILRGHEDAVWSAAFSPDGSVVVTASYDGTARLWDAASGAELRVLRDHERGVLSAALSPDGSLIVTASTDGTARLWDASTGAELRVLRGHERGVLSAVFSLDGSLIVTASEDGTARLWDATRGKERRVLRGHENEVWSAALSPDGSLVVTASNDATVRLWDASSGKELRVLRGHQGAVLSAAFSADGSLAVTAGGDGTVRLWEASSGENVRVLSGHEGSVWSAGFSLDGSLLVTASDDGTARLWDATRSEERLVLRGHQDDVWNAAFSPDGSQIVTASSDGTARLWDASSGAQLQVLRGHQKRLRSAAFSPDGRLVVTASDDGTARLWDAASGDELRILGAHHGVVWNAAFSPDGSAVVTAWADGARLWDPATGEALRVLPVQEASVCHAVFSPDGSLVVTASDDGTARLWDASSGAELRVLRGHDSGITSAAFSPDARLVVTASDDGTARLWDASSGSELRVLRGHQDTVRKAAFSPDRSLVVTASDDGTARLWNAASGEELHALHRSDRGWARSAAFSPDGSLVATAADDKTARLWDAATGEELRVLHGHDRGVTSAAFSPDGSMLVSAAFDGTARVWENQTVELLVATARSRVARALTDAERTEYGLRSTALA